MSSNIYQRNLQALNRRYPNLAVRVYSGQDDEEVIIQQTAEGYPTLGVKREGEVHFIHHPQSPLADAKRILTEADGINDHWYFVHLGVGLAYAPLLLQGRQPDTPAGQILIEKSLSVFRRTCELMDISALLENPNVHWIIGDDPSTAYEVCMSQLMQLMANGPKTVRNNPSLHLDGPYYEQCVYRIQEALRFGQSGLLSKQRDGQTYLNNLIRNLKATIEAPGIKPQQSQLRDNPAVIVAAGPSLSKNLEILKGTENRWLIIAVDTALEKCLKNGIHPHLVCTVDPTELNQKHFPRESYPDDISLLFDPEAEPNIVSRFKGRWLTYNSDKHPFFNWFESETGPKGQVKKGAMVSQAAFCVARFLGCNPIIIIGQDLALDPQTGLTHDKDAALVQTVEYYEDDKDHALYPSVLRKDHKFKDKIFWVDGYHGEKVPTAQNLFAYLRLMEREIAATHAKVINATEGGARIAGAEQITFAEAAKQYEQRSFDWDRFFKACADGTSKKKPDHARTLLETLRRRLRQARRVANKAMDIIQPWLEQGPPDCEPQELQRELGPLHQQIFGDPLNEYLIEQTAAATLFDFLKLGPANLAERQARCGELVRRYEAAFRATIEASDFLMPIIEEVDQKIRFGE